MHRANSGAVLQPADDGQLLLEGLERFHKRRQLERLTFGRRGPLIHQRAQWEIDEPHVNFALRRGLTQRRRRRDHGFQERQAHGDTCAPKKCASRKVFLCDEHRCHLLNQNFGFSERNPQLIITLCV
jgi:hypothetical protein